MKRIAEYLLPWRRPKLDWIQLEITSHCNASCMYCPRTEYRSNWQNRQLSPDALRLLFPSLRSTRHIHLQGWGEPFAHPRFFEILALCKEAGYVVSTTTNGSLLAPDSLDQIVRAGLDIIAFSLAGVDERNDSIRRGNSIERTLEAIDKINVTKAKYGTDKPRIHIAYMLLRSGLSELDRLPGLFANRGIDQVVISSLSLIVQPDLESESLLSMKNDEYCELTSRLLDVRNACHASGVGVFFHLTSPHIHNDFCSENIEKALFIGSDGSVSPCVMANLPVAGDNFHYSCGKKTPLGKIVFGNILEHRLADIWNREEYKELRRSFSRVHKRYSCATCLKLRIDNLLGDERS